MLSAPLPPNEADRLDALARYDLPDTSTDPGVDELVQLAAEICGAPIAQVSLIDDARQWTVAHVGLDLPPLQRELTFCAHALLQPDRPLLVPDATRDPRFAGNPLVTGDPHLRAYAGVPLVTGDGQALGTLCVLDRVPRTYSDAQVRTLGILSRQVMAQLDLRRHAAERLLLETALDDAHAFAQSMAQNSTTLIYLIDLEPLRLAYTNQNALTFLGHPQGGTDLIQLIHPDDRHYALSHLGDFAALEPDGVIEFELRVRNAAGQWRWLWHREKVFRRHADGRPTQIMGTAQDVTDRKIQEERLRQSEERFQSAIGSMHEGLVVQNRAGEITLSNQQAEEILGLSADQMSGRTSLDPRWRAIHPDGTDWPGETHPALVTLQTGVEQRDVLMGIHKPDGSLTWLAVNAAPIFTDSDRPEAVVVTFADITARRQLEEEKGVLMREAIEQSERDPLTHLYNHRAFHQRLGDAARRIVAEPHAVLMVAAFDTDNFKLFNDTYGHGVGDEVLCSIARALNDCLPDDAVAGRIGGDEFVVLLPRVGRDAGQGWAARLRARVNALSYAPPGETAPVPLRLSMGVALFPDEAPTIAEALELADARALQDKPHVASITNEEIARLRASLSEEVPGFSMLDTLMAAVDTKDRYTRRHSEGALIHALQIAREMGLTEAQQRTLQIAALIHDVGKIGVPDRVLRRPGALSSEEMEMVRRHAELGALLVGTVPALAHTLDAVRHHHERWDGGGYPSGLRAEAIPLAARILAVADAYAAMTMDRPYRRGLPPEEAAARLRAAGGRQWDSDCVAALLRCLEASRLIRPRREPALVSGR